MKKLTVNDIENVIADVEYIVKGTMTICVLTLKNGYKVTGESACLDEANFNAEIGKNVAHTKAVAKIWELEGYLLAQKRYEEANNAKG